MAKMNYKSPKEAMPSNDLANFATSGGNWSSVLPGPIFNFLHIDSELTD